MSLAICAKCGEDKHLCNSAKMDGIQQPRLCKECLIKGLRGDTEINTVYWLVQLSQLGESDSIELLKKQTDEEEGRSTTCH